jgi:O-antigen/teichoic acid export membrane protein
MSLKSKNSLLKNGIYNLAGGVAKIALGIAIIPILIRSLGMEEYGLWTLASSILGVVNLAEAGLSTATTVFVSQDLSKKDDSALSDTITVSLLMMLFLATVAGGTLFLSSGLIVRWYPGLTISQATVLLHSLRISSLVVWCRLIQQVLIGIEQAYQRYDLINVVNTLFSTITSIGIITIVLSSGKIIQIIQYQLLTSIIFLVIHCWIVKKLVSAAKLRFHIASSKMIDMGKYSLMMWITSIGAVLFTRVDRLVIGSILGPKHLGIYSAITDIASQINVLSGMAVQPLISSLSNEIDIKSESVKRRVKKSLLTNLYISLVLGLLINSFSPLILSILLKQNTEDIDNNFLFSFKLGILIYTLYSVNGSGYYVLLGTKRVDVCSTITLLVGAISITLIYFGCVNLGLVGAVLGNAGFLGVYAFTWTSMRIVGTPFSKYFRDLLYPSTCFIITLGISLFSQLDIRTIVLLTLISLITISMLVKTSIDKLMTE